jgi:hypothetical protein
MSFLIWSCTPLEKPRSKHTETDTNKINQIPNANFPAASPKEETKKDETKIDDPNTWWSVLFPKDWQPKDEMGLGGTTDQQGRFLPDFSYAGYHRGEDSVNWSASRISKTITIDQNMYGNGIDDASIAIQMAINTLCNEANLEKKLRVVHIPAGTYLLKIPNEQASTAIHIHCSYLVLSGDGANTKLLFNDPEHARNKSVILLAGKGRLNRIMGTERILEQDTIAEQNRIFISSTADVAAGDWVLVRNNITEAFKAEHRMQDYWGEFNGLFYTRKIISKTPNAITLDIPLRYPLKKRDQARVIKINEKDFIEESGIIKLSIGMVQSAPPAAPGASESAIDGDYNILGTPAYKVAFSNAIRIDGAHDSWIDSINFFEPAQNNGSGVHVLSHGISLGLSAFRINVDNCNFGRPQYRGGGGNGYGYPMAGSDNLIKNSTASYCRHGVSITAAASGNVFKKLTLESSRLSEDTHKYLANANLWDTITLDDAFLSALNRGSSSGGAGFTSTAGVFWNTCVKKNHKDLKNCAVESVQWGWGYIIGTSASTGQKSNICLQTESNPLWAQLDQDSSKKDFSEGEGTGATLAPQSLYEAQLKLRRCKLDGGKNCSAN